MNKITYHTKQFIETRGKVIPMVLWSDDFHHINYYRKPRKNRMWDILYSAIGNNDIMATREEIMENVETFIEMKVEELVEKYENIDEEEARAHFIHHIGLKIGSGYSTDTYRRFVRNGIKQILPFEKATIMNLQFKIDFSYLLDSDLDRDNLQKTIKGENDFWAKYNKIRNWISVHKDGSFTLIAKDCRFKYYDNYNKLMKLRKDGNTPDSKKTKKRTKPYCYVLETNYGYYIMGLNRRGTLQLSNEIERAIKFPSMNQAEKYIEKLALEKHRDYAEELKIIKHNESITY
jgi:hypothetical protein